MTQRRSPLIGGLVALGVLLAGCGDDGGDSGAEASASTGSAAGTPLVVTTTGIWGDVVGNVACDGLVEVDVLIPTGADPHSFEPSLADRSSMAGAALVVANGLSLEEGLEDTIDAVEADGTPVFRIAEHVETLRSGDEGDGDGDGDDEADATAGHDQEDEEDGDGHGHDGDDPHVWFDPARVSAALPDLAGALVDAAGLDVDAVDACLTAYQADLAEVDQEMAATLGEVPSDRRKLVTNHDALAYLADRYGFEVVGTVIPSSSSLAEPNPADLEELAEAIEAAGIDAIFADSQDATDTAESLADRIGEVEVVALPTGTLGEPGSGAETYVGLLRTTAQRIADGLG